MVWLGRKKVAFVPLIRTSAAPPDVLPADWAGDIQRRLLYDPDPVSGADRSLRTYIRTVSSGRADIEPVVLPMATTDVRDVRLGLLDAMLDGPGLRAQGFDAGAAVMLGGPGAGTAQTGGFWARFVMVENLGVWVMELVHVLTAFRDLYHLGGYSDPPSSAMGGFDEMSCSCGTHPSAYTKLALQWLEPSSVPQQADRMADYALDAIGFQQPPAAGRVTAVRIGSEVPYLMVEARLKNDQFERKSEAEGGIPSEGVIVYRVQTTDPLGGAQGDRIPVYLLTPNALMVGQSYTDGSASITVTGAIPGGYTISVYHGGAPFRSGELLSYGDNGTPGNVSSPVVVGFGGWAQFKSLFAGGDRIYAVDADGQLLSYGDNGAPGNVSDPVIVGFGGWADFKFLFAGNGRIYAVDADGQLLSYGDSGTPGNVSDPVVVGFGGWADFKFLFAGNGRIYAVDADGQLLSYGDSGTPGNVSDPVVVGLGGWLPFKFLFAGNGRIYAVDSDGQLLSYGDNGAPGNVSDPVVVGFGGWLQFKFLFAGSGRIYAAVA